MPKRWISSLALAALSVALLPSTALGAGANDTALGDSIAYGTGASTRANGYVNLFRTWLQNKLGDTVSLSNQAMPGFRTSDLLFQLQIDGTTRNAVRNAQVLTISIGGNNLLRCASNNYTVLDTTCGANGVASFKRDWPKILSQIRTSIGSKANLYVLTLYNPYKGDDLNYATADNFIQQVNAAIKDGSYSSIYNYKVADAYTDFQGQSGDKTWKVCNWTHFCETTRDPHPTDAGHSEIAQLHEKIYP